MVRQAARVDANQKAIVEGLRAAGCFVQSLAALGRGCPDLLVGYRGSWHVLEIKDGDKIISRHCLTKPEIMWVLDVRNRAPVHVVRSIEEALEIVRGGCV